ncbi:peroxidase domain-containing protein [Phthorimaea operculella]|nr:peroxidase domain-containing protein [Phthorimaea operculella]
MQIAKLTHMTAPDCTLLDDEPPKPNKIPADLIAECMRCGRELTRAANKRANQLVKSGISLEACSPAMHHFFSSTQPYETKKAAQTSQEMLAAAKLLQMKLCSGANVTPNTFMSFLESQVVRVNDATWCSPLTLSCKKREPYRSIDGTCNNVEHPNWGRKGAQLTRIAKPRYADGIYAMPVAVSGRQLPNARVLSTRLFSDQPIPSRVLTYLNMQWGQLVTHDLTFQIMEVSDEGGIQCCLGNSVDVLPPQWLNDKCIPICVPDDDPFYRNHGVRCLNFVRSVTTPRDDCSLGPAEQMNTVTSFLDASMIYGSDKKTALKLRSFSRGRLKEEKRKFSRRGFLPSVDDKSSVCDLRNASEPCYLSGDGRINQSPPLALLHTILLREHNRIADTLSDLNPIWTDEKIYQEARRIVIAELQHITYQEWLPLNFGENYLRYYRISPSTLYSHDYSEEVNPGVLNSFATAAFRFMHSVVPDSIMTCPDNYQTGYLYNFATAAFRFMHSVVPDSIMTCPDNYQTGYLYKLSDHYMNPSLLEASATSFDDLLRGILTQSCAESDPYRTGEITNLLFKSCNKWGMDLIAMDIQRGRDHGLGSYNEYREICGLRRAKTFQDLAGEIPQDRINALAQLYESVDDIDLFVGGAMERDVAGSILGHTFQCIVAEQFYRTRTGDRYFYDNSEMPHSFTSEQLQQIKKASMARLVCDNSDVKFVQKRAFEMETSYNPKCSCDDYTAIPKVDLTAWKS